MDRDTYIFQNVKRHFNYIKDKYEVVGIFLQGSQNYGLDIYDEEYKSDIDTKAIVLPSFEDIVYNRPPVSTTLVLENNEHIDVKDVRIMFDTFKKQNINFLEILFTKYKIINPKYKNIIQPLFDNNERIARLDVNKGLNCQAGMSQQKYVALKHPYPTLIDKIEKYGYDPKQLHHIVRMFDFINKFVKGKPYSECLIADDKDYLISIKKGILPLDQAEYLARTTNQATYEISKIYQSEDRSIDETAIKVLDDVKFELLKLYFQEQLMPKIQTEEFIPKQTYVISDTHFYHDNIIDFENRPYSSVDEMNEKMIDKWNKIVTDDDLVYILGDFSFGSSRQTNDLLKNLKGKKILIVGNHDHFLESKHFDKSLFLEITYCKKINIDNTNIYLCHYPFASNDTNGFQLYGHLHSNRKDDIHWCDTKLLPKNSYNVGADLHDYAPINIRHIIKLIKGDIHG